MCVCVGVCHKWCVTSPWGAVIACLKEWSVCRTEKLINGHDPPVASPWPP